MPEERRRNDDEPAYANAAGDDTTQTPSIELAPGTLPQRPMKDRAPSRGQATQDPESGDAASVGAVEADKDGNQSAKPATE